MNSKIPLLDAADVRIEFGKLFFLPMTDITFEATLDATLENNCNSVFNHQLSSLLDNYDETKEIHEVPYQCQ